MPAAISLRARGLAAGVGSVDAAGPRRGRGQTMRSITALSSNGVGSRAIIKAVAGQHGITGDDDVERLYSGLSEVKLKAPKYVRQAVIDVGLESALAPVNMLTFAEPEQILLSDEAWKDLEFEVALDSGSVVHVCSVDDVPA